LKALQPTKLRLNCAQVLISISLFNPSIGWRALWHCPVEASPTKAEPAKITPAAKAFNTLSQAKRCYDVQKYREAADLATIVIDSGNYAGTAYWIRANSLLRLDKPLEALKDLDASEKAGFVIDPSVYEARARCHVETGNWKQALKELDRAIAVRPVVSAYRMQGEIYFQQKLDDRAVRCLKKALTIDPGDYWSNRDLASLYDSRKEYDKALFHCNRMIRLRPKEPDGYGLRAKIYQHMGKPDMAKKDMEQSNSKSDFPF
jgi:tetratricopeptide (TPR) repeat protein